MPTYSTEFKDDIVRKMMLPLLAKASSHYSNRSDERSLMG